MRYRELEGIISWLKFFDFEYIGEPLFQELSALNANKPEELEKAVFLAILPEHQALNEISKKSMLRILDLALAASEPELKPYFQRICMPFSPPLPSEHVFVKAIHRCIHG